MKISVLIIAHNEELYIEKCLDSLVHQTRKPDEIILIVHNCTDKTRKKAEKYTEVQVFVLDTQEVGPTIARKYGFERVTGDIIACIDGDTVAHREWLKHIIEAFHTEKVVATGGKVFFYDNFLGNLTSFFFFLGGHISLISHVFPFYFWGANFACRKEIYEKVGGFSQVQKIQKKLQLHYDAEDCILSFLLRKSGKVLYISDAKTYSYAHSSFDSENRGKKQRSDFKKIYTYFAEK